ncbi:Tat pathway signal sequence domain protein [Janibacter sp. Soil728]|uniref:alkaline phosphatase PhoX n=1 Tax=Janibacter sp. Soil728 TaxID=1736393 RepID=UPI0006FE0B6D|nr:alkaline phosphatase PhoX [Janibacter sp. Soil728]KRE39148.1 Tat pathway signal sequence domain protein [Janibacter sp. Soil728]
MSSSNLDRRTLLGGSAGALGLLVAGSAAPFASHASAAQTTRLAAGYGKLTPAGPLLALPEGFSYTVLAESGTTTVGGYAVADSQDAMGCFARPGGGSTIVCNHEVGGDAEVGVPHVDGLVYDAGAKGGTSTLVVTQDNSVVEHYTSVAGTVDNCAGGITPWGTWLTCEETDERAGTHEDDGVTYTFEKDHGYVFEVDPTSQAANIGKANIPLKFLGRFEHEAAVVDPGTGQIYLTEDADEPNGLFYRWTPPAGYRQGKGALHALAEDGAVEVGTLEALVATERNGRHVTDLSLATRTQTTYTTTWVEVPERDAQTMPIREQLTDSQVTRARKLEGQWWGDGGVYFVASYGRTDDGSIHEHDGQVWFFDPKKQTVTLTTIFAVNEDGAGVDGPDNITVSPHGGLVLAEDGDGASQLIGVTDQGKAYRLALNLVDDSEWAGPTFNAAGTTLFANIQGDPGRTFAITGPWGRPSNARG